MHGLLLTKLNPDNKDKKYNLLFYMSIVSAVRGIPELEVRKELAELFGHYDTSSLHRWCKIKKGSRQKIAQKDLITIIKYIQNYIPEIELNSDLMLVESNYRVKRDYQLNESITAERLGLSK